MTDIASLRRKVQVEETDFRSAVSESTMQKIGGAVNWIIDNSTFQVGDLLWSVLDESTFQSLRNTNWVLCDGRSVIGTDYATLTGDANIPDYRGRFLRMQDNGAGIDPNNDPLKSVRADAYRSHTHNLGANAQILQAINVSGSGSDNGVQIAVGIPASTRSATIGGENVFSGTTNSSGSNETRPYTGVGNLFIKINE